DSPFIAAMAAHEGGLWFVSPGDGIMRLPAGWRHFSVLRGPSSGAVAAPGPDSLANTTVKDLALGRDGRLWLVGSSGALDRLDLGTGQVEHVLKAADLPDRALWSVLEDS